MEQHRTLGHARGAGPGCHQHLHRAQPRLRHRLGEMERDVVRRALRGGGDRGSARVLRIGDRGRRPGAQERDAADLQQLSRAAVTSPGCGGHRSAAPGALLRSRTVADFEPAAALALAAGGDQHAWDTIVTAYGEMVWGIARSYRLSRPDAADVVQASWLKLVEHVGDIRDGDRLGAWLATTTRREALAL